MVEVGIRAGVEAGLQRRGMALQEARLKVSLLPVATQHHIAA